VRYANLTGAGGDAPARVRDFEVDGIHPTIAAAAPLAAQLNARRGSDLSVSAGLPISVSLGVLRLVGCDADDWAVGIDIYRLTGARINGSSDAVGQLERLHFVVGGPQVERPRFE